jgi:hypothetical protein
LRFGPANGLIQISLDVCLWARQEQLAFDSGFEGIRFPGHGSPHLFVFLISDSEGRQGPYTALVIQLENDPIRAPGIRRKEALEDVPPRMPPVGINLGGMGL